MLLVYTHKITPRLRYVFTHICKRILGIEVKFTSLVDEFIVHDKLKISYTSKALGNELHIKSHELLYEQGISDIEVNVYDWEETKGFFPTGTTSALPYDIFAASFLLLSRYEEFLPHVKDAQGRFPSTESLGYENNFLDQPIVDIWAYKFKKVLQERFEKYEFPVKKYAVQALIDVEQAYDFYRVGIMRVLGGTVKDMIGLRFDRLWLRIQVLLGMRKDPYDTFSWLINVQKNSDHKFIYFFQLGDYSTFTRNIRYNKETFRELIKIVGDYAEIGVLFSKEALENNKQMKIEKQRMEGIINKSINAVRCISHASSLPDHYREMIHQEAKNDYTMGYPNRLGFRAGTCTPFLYYDLDYESTTPLLINPVCAQSGVFEIHQMRERELNDELDIFLNMLETVKKVNGQFIFSFKNKSFTGKGDDEGQWKQFFRQLVNG